MLFELPDERKRGTSIAGTHSGRAVTHDWITPRFIAALRSKCRKPADGSWHDPIPWEGTMS